MQNWASDAVISLQRSTTQRDMPVYVKRCLTVSVCTIRHNILSETNYCYWGPVLHLRRLSAKNTSYCRFACRPQFHFHFGNWYHCYRRSLLRLHGRLKIGVNFCSIVCSDIVLPCASFDCFCIEILVNNSISFPQCHLCPLILSLSLFLDAQCP